MERPSQDLSRHDGDGYNDCGGHDMAQQDDETRWERTSQGMKSAAKGHQWPTSISITCRYNDYAESASKTNCDYNKRSRPARACINYHIRATGALHGVGAVSFSATCVPLIRATLAFGSGESASAELLHFRPRVLLPAVASLASFAAFLASFAAFFAARSAFAFSRSS